MAMGQTYDASTGIVPCGKEADGSDACTIADFFKMLAIIYDFIVKWIATPLAIISLTVGGILMMMSAGNPNLMTLGKKIFYAAVIGLFLVFGSWVIINTIVTILGYNLNGNTDWNILQ
jgi:hypothetical protein